jgi:HEAT repeat protein
MNELLVRLAGGDLRSDGDADIVADEVIRTPVRFPQLLQGLDVSDDVIRGRAAHALERFSRSLPELVHPHLPQLLAAARDDPLPIVRWHIAMTFANLAMFEVTAGKLVAALMNLLDDDSVFVRSWAISSLTIFAKEYPARSDGIADEIAPLQGDGSVAVRNRAFKAMRVLEGETAELPAGWVKTQRL